jgi:small neutral amino acid transporter SnatA (MarC family)
MGAAAIDVLTGIGAAYAALFPIVNPIGATPVFATLSRG